MPYASMDEVNPAIKGIKPPVTLAQANIIASWADEIEDVESPWAVAISNFKKAYVVKDGSWVKRAAEVDTGELSEAVTKSVSGKDLPASSFLVVEDSEEVGTWHLPVKDAAGKADHGRMGGAWAALHGGYRGQKYEGPGKAAAITKLKALYKAEDMPIPGAAELGEFDPTEDVEQKAQFAAPLHASSFSDVDAAAKAQETMDKLRVRMGQFNALMDNLMWSDEVKDKAAAIRSLTEEFVALLPASLTTTSEREAVEMESELETVKLAETYVGVELLTQGIAEADDRGPMTMKIQPIRPGFGNARDNNYYPAEMLKRDAHKFIGAKMHESDHKDDKSTRTWVSTITDVLGFSDAGAPVCEVLVHNPDFAQRVRNLNDGDQLDKMECSILGDGKFRPGEMDGKKANIVEALTRITDVDWVTKAGAGGKALSISESEDSMSDEDKKDVKLDEGTPPEEPKAEEPKVEVLVKPLAEKEVTDILAETNLPESAKTYLAEGEYQDDAGLKEAVAKHIEYLKTVTGSGKPFGHEGGGTEVTMDEATYDKRYDGIMESHGVRQFGG